MKNKIMIVEDEALIAMAEISMLKKYGYEAFATHNYYDAVKKAKGADLILMDIDLGKGEPDGVDTAREIMKHQDVPIVFLSSHTTPEIVEKAENVTSYGYIVKNSGETIIVTSIKMAMRLYEANQRIKKEEENYRTTLESVGDAIITTDVNGAIGKVNKVAKDLIGDNNLSGKQITDVFNIVNSHTREVVENPVKKVVEPGRILGLANHTTLITQNGKEYQIADSAAPIRDDEGEILGVILVFRDVTEQYEKDEQMRRNNILLEETQKLAHIGSWELDLTKNTLIWSDEIYRIFNLKPQEFEATYEAFLERIHPEDRKMVDEAYTNSIKQNKDGYEIGHRIICKDTEEIRYVYEKCRHIKDGDGAIIRSIGMVQDVTDKTFTKNKIKESEEKYKSLVDYSPIGIFQTHSDGHILFANPSMYHMVGTESEKEAKEYFNDLSSKLYADPDRRDDFIHLLNKHGYVEDFEFEAITKTQRHLWFKMNARRGDKDEEGNFIIDGFTADVTNFKNIEKELREEKTFLEQITETSPLGITKVDKYGQVIYANTTAEEMLGLSKDEITSRTYNDADWEITGVNGEPFPEEKLPFFIVKNTGKTILDAQHTIQDKQGNRRILSINSSPLFIDREFNGMVSILVDITKQRAVENDLKQSIEDKDVLMRELNHRVKNNLKMISSLINIKNSELEDINLIDISRQVDAIQIIHEKIQETGNIESIALKGYVQDLLSAIFSSFSRGSIEIVNNIDGVEIKTKDAIALGLIINEVATNAIKYGFNEEEKPQFIVNMKEDEECYQLYLENTGNRFPDIDIKEVNSLGMQIITSLAQQLKGDVKVVKEPNTTFIIKFKI